MPKEHPNTVLSREHFDLMVDQYDELFVTHMHAYDLTHEMILTMLPFSPQRPLRVLELGLGTGNLTPHECVAMLAGERKQDRKTASLGVLSSQVSTDPYRRNIRPCQHAIQRRTRLKAEP